MHEIHLTSMIVYGSLIIVANVKIFLISKKIANITILITVFSILCYPFMYWLWNIRKTSGVYGFFGRSFNLTFWLTLLVTLGIVILGDLAIEKYYGKCDYLIFLLFRF